MIITRNEDATGTSNRTRREEIVPLFTSTRKHEPEDYGDGSESEGWAWRSNPAICTWKLQTAAMKEAVAPFAMLDAEGDGVFTYWFNHEYLPIEGDGGEDDMSPDNFDEKLAKLMRRYPQFFQGGIPVAGGTRVMSAVKRADKRYLKEFPDPSDRRIRIRRLWTDGELTDAAEFQDYLRQAKPSDDDPNLGAHGQWDEGWAVLITGEPGGGGKAAYDQYQEIKQEFPWVHSFYFEGVVNAAEIAEDAAYATVPTAA